VKRKQNTDKSRDQDHGEPADLAVELKQLVSGNPNVKVICIGESWHVSCMHTPPEGGGHVEMNRNNKVTHQNSTPDRIDKVLSIFSMLAACVFVVLLITLVKVLTK
jgi:hypothetical protein